MMFLASIGDWGAGQVAILVAAIALFAKQWWDAQAAKQAREDQKQELIRQAEKIDNVAAVPAVVVEKLDVIHGLVNGQTTQMLKANLALAEDSLLKSRRLLELTGKSTNGTSVAAAEAAVDLAKTNLDAHEAREAK